MKPLNCAATRRRLNAYHDHELGISEQIAVSSHLEWCDACAEALADMRTVRLALQSVSHARPPLSNEEGAAFAAAVVNQVKAERQTSVATQITSLFEDMHLVYAGLGAAAATALCIVIMLSMMRFATSERPDSLAAMLNVLATPLECEPGPVDPAASACHERWTGRFQRANETAEQDAIFALESVVTRHGRVASLELLRGRRHAAAAADVKLIEGLLDVVSRSRLDMPQSPGLSDLARMVWWVEHATVRATPKPAEDLPLPPTKKRADKSAAAGTAIA
jgi:putative zinc finger protein